MIRQVTVGRSYDWNNERVTVIRHKRGKRGWFPDTVLVQRADGSMTAVFSFKFRDEADQCNSPSN